MELPHAEQAFVDVRSCATIVSVPIILAVSTRLGSLRVFWGGRLTRQKTCGAGSWRQCSGKMLVSSVQMTMGSGMR
jgi:hypothetical protein